MQKCRLIRRGNSGFTLIEICVAIIIVALGILTSMRILLPALKWAGESRVEFGAVQALESAINELQAGALIGNVATSKSSRHPFVSPDGVSSYYCGTFGNYVVGFAKGPGVAGDHTLPENLDNEELPENKLFQDIQVRVWRRPIDLANGGFKAYKVAVGNGNNPVIDTHVNLYRMQ